MNLLKVAARETQIIISHRIYIICMVLLPLAVTILFTSLMYDGQPVEMPVGVVDNDNTTTTRKLIRTLDSFQSSKVVARYPNVDEARQAIQKGEIYAFIYFPRHTTDALLASRQPKISFYYSNTSLMSGTLLFKDLKTMSVLGSAAIGQATLSAKGIPDELIMPILQPVAVDLHTIGNPWINYNIYLSTMLIPGSLLLFILLITAYSLGSELKFGTSKQLMSLSDNNIIVALIGKLLPQTMIFLTVMYLQMLYLFGVLHFPAPGGLWTLAFLGLVSVLATQGLSIFIFSLIPHMRMAMSICSLWGVLSFSMVGSAFPVFAMDAPLQLLAWLFPLRHYFMIYQLNVFNPYPLTDSIQHIIALILFILSPLLLIKRLKKVMNTYEYTA